MGRMTTPRKAYHEMTDEERRAAWASLRERQSAQARRHRRAPVVLGLLTVAAFVTGFTLFHYGVRSAGVIVWAGVGLAGFTIIAIIRNLMGSITTRKDDLTPPGF